MVEMEHAQTILLSDDVKKLKTVTGKDTTKNALSFAVEFTIKNYKKEKKASE